MKNLLILSFIMMVMSSCAYHVGTIGGGTGVITNDKFSSIDFAYGTSSTTSFLGIGGNQKDALVLEAKRNLYLNYKLKPTQVIGQTTVDFKRTLFFPVSTTKVTVSAEIIDFFNEALDTVQDAKNKEQFIGEEFINQVQVVSDYLSLGESVTYVKNGKTYPATILGFDQRRCIIKFIDGNNNLKIKKVESTSLKPRDQTYRAPLNPNEPDRLYTPQNAKGKLIDFRYKGETYTGELIEARRATYFIKMEKGNGEIIGLYIPEKDIKQ